MINSNVPPILHRFQVMADYWSNFAIDMGVTHLTPSLGVIPWGYLFRNQTDCHTRC